MIDKSKYQREYYYRHREKILAKLKNRYHNDELFRQSIKENIKKYVKKKSMEKKLLKEKLKEERKIWKKFNINGEIVQCCRIGYIAKQIGRTSQTLRLWEKNGYINKALTYKNHRYYTRHQAELIINCWNKSNGDLEKFFSCVRINWYNKKGD